MAGIVEQVGPDVTGFNAGDEIYGVTNAQFCGANAEYAIASAKMTAHKPQQLTHVEAASVPVVAVTAWQMLFDHGKAEAKQRVLVLGAAGNVGSYAVQLAANAGLHVISVVSTKDDAYARALGSETVLDYQARRFEDAGDSVDLVLDTVGGETRERSLNLLKTGGVLVSAVSAAPQPMRSDVRSVFFYVEVTTERLNLISQLLDLGQLTTRVGSVLPLEDIRTAHKMLAGAPHKRGKIVLQFAT